MGKTSFKVISTDKKARNGVLNTSRGEVDTPVFLPVATQATIKALDPSDLVAMGEFSPQMILSNTYHLYLRPGAETIAKLGGLHKFMNWKRPILTDSGGFQVFSLGFGIEHEVGKIVSLYGEKLVVGEVGGGVGEVRDMVVRTKLCKIEEEGPTFQSHIDGSVHFFSPEKSVETQEKLGADFIVALDECTSPLHDYDYTKASMNRSHRWELRSLKAFNERNLKFKISNLKLPKNQEIFGVVQGGPFRDLRIESAKFVSENGFFGVGIGGALVSKEKMHEILDWINPCLDPQKPRHLLGIGGIDDIFEAVERGVDMFDCVAPTRAARFGRLLHKKYCSNHFFLDITKMENSDDENPVDKNCGCHTCQTYSRAYVHHLFKSHELLAHRLATIHNIYFMMKLMKEIRGAIAEKRLAKLKNEWL